MRRTEALQGVRVAVFLNILDRWELAELNQDEAAELLGVSERTFRRWTRRYEEEGEAGLLDRRLGKASGKRVPVDRAEEVEALYRERYQGFTVKHFHEHLVKDHGFGWGYTWTKLHLQWAGLAAKAPRKGAHRRKRERRPLPGMMLHQDGSRHGWLEGEPALDLIVTMDDATGAIYSAFLIAEEGTASTFRALKEVFGEHGLPMSIYTDRARTTFTRPKPAARSIAAIPRRWGGRSNSSGLSISGPIRLRRGGARERAFQTLQDRLPKELKLAGIVGVEAANAFIREVYLPAHNARFAVPPAGEGSAFTPIPGVDLDEILCVEEERQVGHDNCVSYHTLKLQIPESPMRPHFVKARVKVHVYADGSHAIFHGPRCIGRYDEKERSGNPMKRKTPPKSARRRACGRHRQASGLPTPPTGEQKQKKRTYDVLPKPDNLIRYRHAAWPVAGRTSISPRHSIEWACPRAKAKPGQRIALLRFDACAQSMPIDLRKKMANGSL